MALTKYKLGQLIEQCDNRNKEELYSVDDVRGISTGKEFIETKANMDGVSLSSYKIVRKNEFAYVADTSRRGDKIAIAFNTDNEILISSIYTVFRISRTDLLLSDYLFMYFNRPEFDRYSRFNSWGSARETFDWSDMCDIEIELPSIEIQQKYVAIYKAMVANQQSYERGLEDLKLVCDAYIEDLRRNISSEPIGKYISEIDNRNIDGTIKLVQGVESSGTYMDTRANMDGIDITKYKVVTEGDFAYNPSRINLGSIALRRNGSCIISPMYCVFGVVNTEKIIPEYLSVWFSRKEFQRSTLFYATGSVRDTFDFELMKEVCIPIPEMNIQKSIAGLSKVLNERRKINEQLKNQIKSICPILIKGSLEEGK